MQKPFDVKGIRFGWGRPVVCVPVVEHGREAVIDKIRELTGNRAQMIEWRADCFDQINQPDQVRRILREIAPLVTNTVMLFTIRSKEQGGLSDLQEESVLHLDEIAAASGSIDFVDLELFNLSRPDREIKRLHQSGTRVIASHHDFSGTPSDTALYLVMDQLAKSGADIAKLAVMPHSSGDVIRLLAVTDGAKGRYPGLPVVSIAMGAYGVISRLSGETFGSCISFGADGQGSAPGQLQYKTLTDMLNILHESRRSHIFLIGFMGTGKTSVAGLLGPLLGLDPIDTDEMLVRENGMSITGMFERFGENYFREKETGILRKIAGRDPAVVSCGGGIVLREENISLLRQCGIVILLTAKPETIYERIKDVPGRPVLDGQMSVEHIEDLIRLREPAYDEACDIRIATDGKTPAQIAEEIIGTM